MGWLQVAEMWSLQSREGTVWGSKELDIVQAPKTKGPVSGAAGPAVALHDTTIHNLFPKHNETYSGQNTQASVLGRASPRQADPVG